MTLVLNYTIASDRGLVRDNNEDSAYAGPHLLALADGMGGHAAGEVASQIMVTHMSRLDQKTTADPEQLSEQDMPALLAAYAEDANREIAQTVRSRPETQGMGTTLTALLFDGSSFGLIHVGDSRGYRLRAGKLTQITIDDTFVQTLVNEGKLDPAEVSTHPRKSLILKAYTGERVSPTLNSLDAEEGDRLLLCSDGLSDPVTATTIADALGTGTPEEAAKKLVDLALRSGGPDNVTVVVADVVNKASLPEIPLQPVLGGAPTGRQDDSHPDTSAGRAAAWSRKPKVIPAATHNPPLQAGADIVAGDPDDEEDSPRRGWLISTLIVLTIAGLLGGAWWTWTRIDANYFLSVHPHEGRDELVIEQGVDYALFGRDLHQPRQKACINQAGELRFVDYSAQDPQCTVFALQDVPEAVRATVPNLPGGSYDTVNQQLRRLSEEALPVCITRTDPQGAEAKTPEPGDLSQPGINCREVVR